MSAFQDDLLTDIAAFIGERKIAESTFGRLAVNDSEFVERLRRGKVTLSTIEKVRRYMVAQMSDPAEPQPHRIAS